MQFLSFRLCAVFTALMLPAGVVLADAVVPILAKVGSVAPEGTPWAVWLESVKKRMEKESGGKLKIKAYLGGKLGGEKEIIGEVKEGNIHIFGGSVGALAATYVPELNVFELPFLFDSDEEVDFVLDKMRGQIAKLLEQRGFVLVMFSENGWHGFGSKKKCVNSPADLKGMRMRSQESSIHLSTYKAFGATPVEMAVPDVLSSLNVGVVDGFSNTPVFTFASGWYRPMTHFSYTRHIYQPAVVMVSKKWLDGLPDDVKKVVMQRTEERSGLAQIRGLVEPLLQNLGEAGLQICRADAKQRQVFQSLVKPVWDGFAKKSEDAKKILSATLAAKKEFVSKKIAQKT